MKIIYKILVLTAVSKVRQSADHNSKRKKKSSINTIGDDNHPFREKMWEFVASQIPKMHKTKNTNKTGSPRYSNTSPFSIPCFLRHRTFVFQTRVRLRRPDHRDGRLQVGRGDIDAVVETSRIRTLPLRKIAHFRRRCPLCPPSKTIVIDDTS
jgi:hypothetical protein